MRKHHVFYISIFIFLKTSFIFPQVYTQWVQRYNYNNFFSPNYGTNINIDDSGFVYITGISAGSLSRNDMVLIKYSTTGNSISTKRFADTTTPYPNNWNGGSSIIFDDTGNVFVGGSRIWKYDGNGNLNWNVYTPFYKGFPKIFFDQNYGLISSTEFANSSFLIRKYSNTGDSLWEKIYKPVGTIFAKWEDAITDNEYNIITVGYMNKFGIGDMYDYITVKYSGNGDLIWAKRYDTGIDNYCYSVTVDKFNNVYVTGFSDLSTSDMLTIKYSPQGNILWEKTFDSGLGDSGYDIEVDRERNVYVAGRSGVYGLTLTKYDENGNTLWFRNRSDNGIGNIPLLKLDRDGNPYMAFWITTQQGGQLYAIQKYDVNGNQKWLAQYGRDSSTSLQKIYDILIDSNFNVYVTGRSNNFIATVKFVQNPSSINNSSSLISEVFFLYQNYPNPFNPVTQLKYSVPNFGFVSLKIFDILGNEIRTLVNENNSKGSYEVEFDGSSLSSGIYYYKLQSGNFTQTRKMLLLK